MRASRAPYRRAAQEAAQEGIRRARAARCSDAQQASQDVSLRPLRRLLRPFSAPATIHSSLFATTEAHLTFRYLHARRFIWVEVL